MFFLVMSHVTCLRFSSKDFFKRLKLYFPFLKTAPVKCATRVETRVTSFLYLGQLGAIPIQPKNAKPPRQMPDKSQVKPTAKAGHCSLLSMKQFQAHSSTSKLGFIWGRVSFPQCFEMEEMQRLLCSGYQKSGCGKIRSRA